MLSISDYHQKFRVYSSEHISQSTERKQTTSLQQEKQKRKFTLPPPPLKSSLKSLPLETENQIKTVRKVEIESQLRITLIPSRKDFLETKHISYRKTNIWDLAFWVGRDTIAHQEINLRDLLWFTKEELKSINKEVLRELSDFHTYIDFIAEYGEKFSEPGDFPESIYNRGLYHFTQLKKNNSKFCLVLEGLKTFDYADYFFKKQAFINMSQDNFFFSHEVKGYEENFYKNSMNFLYQPHLDELLEMLSENRE